MADNLISIHNGTMLSRGVVGAPWLLEVVGRWVCLYCGPSGRGIGSWANMPGTETYPVPDMGGRYGRGLDYGRRKLRYSGGTVENLKYGVLIWKPKS